jgi:hypothetical protein
LLWVIEYRILGSACCQLNCLSLATLGLKMAKGDELEEKSSKNPLKESMSLE